MASVNVRQSMILDTQHYGLIVYPCSDWRDTYLLADEMA